MILTLGSARITSVIEQPLGGLDHLIPSATGEALDPISWLKPHYLTEDGQMHGLIQAFVIEIGGKTIVVDPCVGDRKSLPVSPAWNRASLGFMDKFQEAGFDPLAVDLVMCTHMHLDHVGWNTFWDGDAWRPTFPKARYLFARVEYEHWLSESLRTLTVPPDANPNDKGKALFAISQQHVQRESIQPVFEAGLADLVDIPCSPAQGVSLVPTPGHTPGHVSVEITCGGKTALITGDSFHHPCQIARPDWATVVDHDQAAGTRTRRHILDRLKGTEHLMLGTHFAEPWAGKIIEGPDGCELSASASDLLSQS
jgi:glyoxylase-like metal-dependent hydrolase (beta-lactamase superfamily II)